MTVYARIRNQITTTPSYPNGLVVTGGMSIGTNIDADVPLKVGTVTATGQIGLNLTSNTGAHLQLTDIGNVDMSLGVLDGQSALSFHTGRNRQSNGTELMRLTSSGNVGIGTSSPITLLHIDTSGYGALYLGANNSNGFHVTKESSDNSFNIWSGVFGSGTNRLKISSSGQFTFSSATSQNVATFFYPTAGGYSEISVNSNDRQIVLGQRSSTYSSGDLAYLYTPSATPFAIYTSASERMRISSSGSVGIGTSSPANKLHIAGETAQYPTSLYIAPTGHATSRRAGIAVDNWEWMQDIGGNGTKDFGLYDRDDGTIRVYVGTSGNVGIGTSSPSEKLHISNGNFAIDKSAYGGFLKWTQGTTSPRSGYWEWGDGTGWRLDFGPPATPRLSIYDNGNVGIGTSSPGSKLDVAGSINTSSSLTIGSQGGTIDDYSAGNQALRIYTNTAGKGLWIGFPGGIVLNNPTMIVGSLSAGAGGAFLNSTVSDNFILRTQTNTPNPNWSIGYGDGSGSIDTTKEYLVSNAGTITVKSGNFNVTGSTLLGSYLSLGQVPNQIGGTRFTVHESMAKSQSSAATPNQSIRWTWYNDADGAIVGTRQYQLWVYPYSNQSGALAIFDQIMAFSIPTYTETSINVSGITTGGRYIITSLGNTTQAQWNAMAGTSGNTYVVNNWFNAAANGPSGTTGTVIYTSYTKLIVNNAHTQFNYGLTFAASSISANTTLDGTYTHVFASGTITITLPTAVGISGRTYWIKRTGTGTITIATTSSQTIDGAASLSISAQYDSYTLVSDGANWYIM